MEKEDGFTLVELLFLMALMSILMIMGAFAARQFWFQRSLTGAQDGIAVQLRALQTRTVAEGITTRYYGAWFTPGSDRWGTVRYSGSTCTITGDFRFDAGVNVQSVNFSDTGVGAIDVTSAIANCKTQLSLSNSTDFVFFFSRGTATQGSTAAGDGTANLVLVQPRLNDRTEEIRVLGLTARVEKL